MSLVGMHSLLADAQAGDYAVGSFSVGNMEMVLGVVEAAQALQTPVILQIAQARLHASPLHIMGPMMVAAAQNATVPIAVHFDHGTTLETIEQALQLGFTSVMFDGSHLSFEENVAQTRAAGALARKYGAVLEAEIGRVGGSEGGEASAVVCSDPDEAARFVEATHVDALAVAIGNAHGAYKGIPKLDMETLRAIREKVTVPLVLHGGSGIGKEGFRACIRGGVRKVNIATASFQALEQAARTRYATQDQHDYFLLSRLMREAVRENVEEHLHIFETTAM